MPDDDKVVSFRSGAPSARLKELHWNDKRALCQHMSVEVWTSEPILECADCGAVVDPYQWIRNRVKDWAHMENEAKYRVDDAKREIADLKKTLKALRGEVDDAAEANRVKHALMVMPPRRRGA